MMYSNGDFIGQYGERTTDNQLLQLALEFITIVIRKELCNWYGCNFIDYGNGNVFNFCRSVVTGFNLNVTGL